jgi:bifunctional UDP-N-acetylglucosamine pyrophosphorylase/glucosamine-1-phosphate N-acetyltransferase
MTFFMTRPSPANRNRPKTPVACLILAAGKGTRMNSSKSKVLHRLLGAPLISYPVLRAQELGAAPVVAVLGHQLEAVQAELVARHGDDAVTVVEQAEQKGTGHAVRLGLKPLAKWDGIVVILYGDVPMLRRETLTALVDEAQKTGGLAMLTARVPDPTGYGRVIRDGKGRVARIVEHKDATPVEREVNEINAGIYAGPAEFLRKAVAKLVPQNAQGEYYVTDIVERAAGSIGASTILVDAQEVAGINDRRQLAEAERALCRRLVSQWQEHVTFRDPESVWIEPGVTLEPDVEIGRNVALRGRTKIARGARIDDGAILEDAVVGEGTEIRPYCVIVEAEIGANAIIGPFARLRTGTRLSDGVHIGNFVETKKAVLGLGSKANHLTYLGDVTVGDKVNVGAGTITCNYNGYEKFETVIEDGANIGSDTQLVAPVKVGKRAVIAAGTTVVTNVPDGALAISRVEQKNVPGYADKVAARYQKAGKAAGKGALGGRKAG